MPLPPMMEMNLLVWEKVTKANTLEMKLHRRTHCLGTIRSRRISQPIPRIRFNSRMSFPGQAHTRTVPLDQLIQHPPWAILPPLTLSVPLSQP